MRIAPATTCRGWREDTRRAKTTTVVLGAAGLLLGCLGPRVIELPSGPGVHAESKAPDCRLDFYRTKVDRPYDEIAALHASGGDTFKNGPEAFQHAVRAKACELGADAVIVTQDFSGYGGMMNATAIKYRDTTAASR